MPSWATPVFSFLKNNWKLVLGALITAVVVWLANDYLETQEANRQLRQDTTRMRHNIEAVQDSQRVLRQEVDDKGQVVRELSGRLARIGMREAERERIREENPDVAEHADSTGREIVGEQEFTVSRPDIVSTDTVPVSTDTLDIRYFLVDREVQGGHLTVDGAVGPDSAFINTDLAIDPCQLTVWELRGDASVEQIQETEGLCRVSVRGAPTAPEQEIVQRQGGLRWEHVGLGTGIGLAGAGLITGEPALTGAGGAIGVVSLGITIF